jgi:hypothetical protein
VDETRTFFDPFGLRFDSIGSDQVVSCALHAGAVLSHLRLTKDEKRLVVTDYFLIEDLAQVALSMRKATTRSM